MIEDVSRLQNALEGEIDTLEAMVEMHRPKES